jgi:hypothetical protein
MSIAIKWTTDLELLLAQKLEIYQDHLAEIESVTKKQRSCYTLLTILCLLLSPIPGFIAAIEVVMDDNPDIPAAVATAICSAMTSFIVSVFKFYRFEEKIRTGANLDTVIRGDIEYLSGQLVLPLSLRDSATIVLRRFYKSEQPIRDDQNTETRSTPPVVLSGFPSEDTLSIRAEYEKSRLASVGVVGLRNQEIT